MKLKYRYFPTSKARVQLGCFIPFIWFYFVAQCLFVSTSGGNNFVKYFRSLNTKQSRYCLNLLKHHTYDV